MILVTLSFSHSLIPVPRGGDLRLLTDSTYTRQQPLASSVHTLSCAVHTAPGCLTASLASLETHLATPALMDMTVGLQDLPMLCLVAVCTAVAIAAVHQRPLVLLNYLRYRRHPLYKRALQRTASTELNLESESAHSWPSVALAAAACFCPVACFVFSGWRCACTGGVAAAR